MMVLFLKAAFCFTKYELMDWHGVDYLWIIIMFLSAVWTLILYIESRKLKNSSFFGIPFSF